MAKTLQYLLRIRFNFRANLMRIISVYNSEGLLRAGLLASAPAFLEKIKIELVDNTNNQYHSMADAIRSVISKFTPDEILVFAHQDVLFYDPDSFNLISQNIKSIKSDIYFAGVVGVKPLSENVENCGVNRIISGGKLLPFAIIDRPTPVETIDECVLITNANTIKRYNLLNDARLGWHLYAVDASLAMAQNGYNSYVLPLSVNHLSRGRCTPQYFELGKYLLQKYNLKIINTTNGPLTKWSVQTRKIKAILKGYLKLV